MNLWGQGDVGIIHSFDWCIYKLVNYEVCDLFKNRQNNFKINLPFKNNLKNFKVANLIICMCNGKCLLTIGKYFVMYLLVDW